MPPVILSNTDLTAITPNATSFRRNRQTIFDDPLAIMLVARLSLRSVGRCFAEQPGLSFAAWTQRARVLRAMEALAAWAAVTSVALDMGYDSVSAFIALFRRETDTTPGAFLRDASAAGIAGGDQGCAA